MSTFAAVIRANGVVKQFCPDIWPLQAPRTVSIADALREINDFIAVSLCVNTAFNSMMQELKIVREERDTLCEKNLSLRQKLGLPLGLADHDAVDGFPPRSTPSTVPRQSVAKNEMERRRSIIISEVPELGDVSIERRVRYDVHNILFHKFVDCLSIGVYRLGRSTAIRNRLLKVTFPGVIFFYFF